MPSFKVETIPVRPKSKISIAKPNNPPGPVSLSTASGTLKEAVGLTAGGGWNLLGIPNLGSNVGALGLMPSNLATRSPLS